MAGRILLFHPNNPWPVRSGWDRRFWELATALRELGWDTHLVSASYTSSRPWSVEAIEAFHSLSIRVWLAPPLSPWRGWAKRRARRKFDEDGRFAALARAACPVPLRRHFQKLVRRLAPDRILILGSLWSDLIPKTWRHRPETLVDASDLLSRNFALQRDLQASSAPVDPGEWRALSRFGKILALSEAEAAEIASHVRESEIRYLPMCVSGEPEPSDLKGEGVLIASNNVFNRQGCRFLTREVLSRTHTNFQIHLFGECEAEKHPKLVKEGPVSDADAAYRHARFLACPASGGTGEQWKIVEAMSYGVPVVALESGVRGAPVVHGESGFIVKDGEEFARSCLRLTKDVSLAREMGRAAREKIRAERSRPRLVSGLRAALGK